MSYFANPPKGDAQQCVVDVLGLEINTASFAMYTFSISVLAQALLIISMSGAADHGRYGITKMTEVWWNHTLTWTLDSARRFF